MVGLIAWQERGKAACAALAQAHLNFSMLCDTRCFFRREAKGMHLTS